jgi:hypothetical protein
MSKRKRKPGRPSLPRAKRNATTREGRRTGYDPIDRGTPELRARRRSVTGHESLPHDDPLSAMLGHQQLTVAQYNAGRGIAELLLALRERYGNVWLGILLGTGSNRSALPPATLAAERVERQLRRLIEIIGPAAPLVLAVCGGQWWASHAVHQVAEGLEQVARRWTFRSELNSNSVKRYYLGKPNERPNNQDA